MQVSINYDRNNLITIKPEDSKYEVSSKEEIDRIFNNTIETLTNLIILFLRIIEFLLK